MRRLSWIIYGGALIIAAFALRQVWQQHYDSNLLAARERISESVRRVDNLIDASTSHVNMLRISADDTLSDIKAGGISVSPLYSYIKPAPDIGGYCLQNTPHLANRPEVSLSGLGTPPVAGTKAADELNMALLLNPQFAATAQNIPNLAWAYYTSARGFIVMYPFVGCSDFHFSVDLLNYEFFRLGKPDVNPERRYFWTQAYMDQAGKGLMATVGAPVYDSGRFLGTVAIDLTLEGLSEYVRDPHDTLGTAFIVNDQGQLLAHPTLIKKDDTAAHQVEEVFEDRLAEPMKALLNDPQDTFVEHDGLFVYASRMRGAPWRYVYSVEQSALFWQAVLDSKLEIAGAILLLMLIAAFDRAKRVSASLQVERDRAERAESDARQANRAKSVILANASHDLRTPLNAIIGFSELVLTKPYGAIGSPKYEEYVHDIHSSGSLLLSIVNDLLDLSKIEAGRYEMHEEAIDVAQLIARTRTLVSTQAERSGVGLEVQVAVGKSALWADLRAMQQIMLNLLSNAIKFTPSGGKVTVRADGDSGSGLTIEVADTGKGISASDLELLFMPFSRGASADVANTQGTGLGLTIVKSLAELHGGTIAISSTVGTGTTVTFRLPPERLTPVEETPAQPAVQSLPIVKPSRSAAAE